VRQRQHGTAPILLLDEIIAHLDPLRRAALLAEIIALGTQAWMSGTDPEAFSGLGGQGQFLHLQEGRIAPLGRASAATLQVKTSY
jgi:DNA replication and repair protein RecF